MKYRSRVLLATAVLGLASALVLIVVTFVVSLKFREFAYLVMTPGQWLVRVSDQVCPPNAVECFFGSSRQGVHHLWLLFCAFISWSFIFSAAWWSGLTLAARIKARAYLDRRPLFTHRRQGTS